MKELLPKILLYLFLGVGCFALGRYLTPTKVEIREIQHETVKVVEKVDEKKLEELTLQVRLALTKVEQLKKSIHKEKTSTTFPDGRIEAKEVVDVNVDRTVQTTQVKEVEKQVIVVQERVVDRVVTQDRVVEKEKIVTANKPDWRLMPMLGVNVPDALKGDLKPVFGASVERRLIGPISGGLWGLTSGTAGVSLSVEF